MGNIEIHGSGRFVLTFEEETCNYFLNDEKTGKCYDLMQSDYSVALSVAQQEAASIINEEVPS